MVATDNLKKPSIIVILHHFMRLLCGEIAVYQMSV